MIAIFKHLYKITTKFADEDYQNVKRDFTDLTDSIESYRVEMLALKENYEKLVPQLNSLKKQIEQKYSLLFNLKKIKLNEVNNEEIPIVKLWKKCF